MKIPKIEYDLYCALSGGKLEKLNLSICENTKVYLLIPKEININYDILNSSSGYYNDICYTTTSDSGTDIPLNDRKNEYVNNTVCQDDCDFSDYDKNKQKVNCSCKAKESSNNYTNMSIDKSNLFKNFINLKNIANINILACYKKLFSKNGIIHNIGAYIIVFIILLHIIFIFIFYIRQIDSIKAKLKDILFGIINSKLLNYEKEIKTKQNEKSNIKRKEKKSLKDKDYKKNNSNRKDKGINKNYINNKNKLILMDENNDKNKKLIMRKSNKNIINNNVIEFTLAEDNHISRMRKIKKTKNKTINTNKGQNNILTNNLKTEIKEMVKKVKKIMEYTDDEINDLPYDLALEFDKRNYCQYYTSLLKTKHNFLFSFFYNNDYNSKIIKIDLYFVDFVLNYAINGLFFDDDEIHTIYINKGSFDIKEEIQKIVYSSLITMIIDVILNLLALSSDNIIDFKQQKTVNNINKKKRKLERILKLKFISYFIITSILLLFFWYYISIFGVIYRNTQYHLLKDNLISLVLSLLTPFIFYILPGLFRIPSLSNPKKKRNCLYRISKFLQFI